MANSDAEGLLKFDPSDWGEYYPHDSLHARIAMNNAAHLADEDGQVRVNFAGAPITNASGSTTLWYRMAQFGPFPLRLAPSGVPYPLRARVSGLSTAAATQVRMRVVVSARGTALSEALAAGANVLDVTTSSTTNAWLTATTGASGTTLLSFNDEQTNDAFRSSLPTVDAIAGDPIAVETFEWVATVFGQNTGASEVEPGLSGLYLAEFVGV